MQRLGASIKADLQQQYQGLGGPGLELGGEPAGQESLPPPGEKQQPLGSAEQVRLCCMRLGGEHCMPEDAGWAGEA